MKITGKNVLAFLSFVLMGSMALPVSAQTHQRGNIAASHQGRPERTSSRAGAVARTDHSTPGRTAISQSHRSEQRQMRPQNSASAANLRQENARANVNVTESRNYSRQRNNYGYNRGDNGSNRVAAPSGSIAQHHSGYRASSALADSHNHPTRTYSSDRGSMYNTSYRRGYQTRRIPTGHLPVAYRGESYRYYNGVFYRPYGNRFVVVSPPVGIRVNILPRAYYRVVLDRHVYYYYDGVYYNRYGNDYQVIAPPVGARVPSLPFGSTVVYINNMRYYEFDHTYYQEIILPNNEVWYEVVGKG